MSKNKVGFFIDYYRTPKDLPPGIDEWVVFRSDKEFTQGLSTFYKEWKMMPKLFSFDHWLHPEHFEFYFMQPKGTLPNYELFENKTGMHSLKFLCEVCRMNSIPMDFKLAIHTEDKNGGMLMQKLANSYKEEQDCFLMDWKNYDYHPENHARYMEMKDKEYNEILEQERIENIAKKLEKELYGKS